MEQNQKSRPSRWMGQGHCEIWTWHIDFDLETNKKSNKNGSMYIILHLVHPYGECCKNMQKCSGLSEIFLRLTSRTHLWDCRRLEIPRRSCENVCRFHQHHATLWRSLKLFPQIPRHRVRKVWLKFKSGRSWKQESRWKLFCKDLWVYKTMTMMWSLESGNFVPQN